MARRLSELVHLPGHDRLEDFKLPLPHTYINSTELPANFNWQNINGTSYVTKSLNQHIPQVKERCAGPSTPASGSNLLTLTPSA